MGIEPTPSAWKAEVLPLNYTRITRDCAPHGGSTCVVDEASSPSVRFHAVTDSPSAAVSHRNRETMKRSACSLEPGSCREKIATPVHNTGNWWRGEDSNLRRLSRQIYSLIPLTTREPLQQPSATSYNLFELPSTRGCRPVGLARPSTADPLQPLRPTFW